MSGYYDNYPKGLDFAKDTAGSTLGFANRNNIATETGVLWPAAVRRLGANYAKLLNDPMNTSLITDHANPMWLNPSTGTRAPGFIVFDIEPIFAPTRGDGQGIADENVHYSEETYNSLWAYLRLYDAAVGDMQATDLAAIDYGNMLLRYYLSFFLKALRAANTCLSDSNGYQQAKVILRALGFTEDANNLSTLIDKLPGIIKRLNQWVTSTTRIVKVLCNTFPGAKRLPALVTEWYRDVETETDYAQMYTFKPKHWWSISYYVGHENKHCYNIVKSIMPTSMSAYVDRLIDMIKILFWDESSLQVQRYLNKVVESGTGMPGDVSVQTYEISDFIYPNTADIGFDAFEAKYDRDMLLAIHNATILRGADVSAAYQEPGKVRWQQVVAFERNSPADVVSRINKPLNLPWRDATNGDLINAMQWCVIRHKEAAWADVDEIDPRVLGTDIIVGATLWKLDSDDILNPNCSGYEINQVYYTEGTPEGLPVEVVNTLNDLSFFDHAPITYIVSGREPDIQAAGHVIGMNCQAECLFVSSYDSLADIKTEFVKNYWGFPFILETAAGSFSTHNVATDVRSIATSAGPDYGDLTENRDFEKPSQVFNLKGNSALQDKKKADKRTARSQNWKAQNNKNKKDDTSAE